METLLVSKITALAASQHGAVSARQLDRHGLSRQHVRTALARGWLRKVVPRVFVVAGAPDTLEQRQAVALPCLGPTAALSHEAAARLHRFDRCRPDVVELTVPRDGRGRAVPFCVQPPTRSSGSTS